MKTLPITLSSLPDLGIFFVFSIILFFVCLFLICQMETGRVVYIVTVNLDNEDIVELLWKSCALILQSNLVIIF